MESEFVSRAMAAATALAGELHLRVDDAVVIHNSNKLALRLLPCCVFARVALVGQEVAALEVARWMGQSLVLDGLICAGEGQGAFVARCRAGMGFARFSGLAVV